MIHAPLRRSAVALALSLLAAGAAQAGIYLNLPEVPGEATAAGHKGWIDLNSVQWGAGVGISSGSGGRRREASAPSVSEISWSQNLDSSVPPLFGKAFSGTITPTSKIDLVASGKGKGTPYLSLETEKVAITGVSLSNDSVSASQGYAKFTMTYDPTGLGDSGQVVSTTYDVLRNETEGPTHRAAEKFTGTVPAAGAGTSMYLRLGSGAAAIAGDSRAAGYENWIKIDSAQMGVGLGYNPATGETGQPSLSELVFTQSFDATVPVVFADLLRGTNIGQATIEYVRGGPAGPVTFMQLALDDVMISGLSLSSGGDLPSVSESLNFTGFSQTFWSIQPDGTRGKAISTGYDVVKGAATTGRLASNVADFGAGNLSPLLAAAGGSEPLPAAPIPEPQTWLMMLAGIGLLAGAARRRAA